MTATLAVRPTTAVSAAGNSAQRSPQSGGPKQRIINGPTVGLGVSSSNPNWIRDTGLPWNYRYQYLAGGVNTGQGWYTWNPNGGFVTRYLQDSEHLKTRTVFTYYQLLNSAPSSGGTEAARNISNLSNPDTMRAYFTDFASLLRLIASSKPSQPVLIHIEPDLNGYAQEYVRNVGATRADALPVAVGSTRYPGLEYLPNHYAGFITALITLRNQIAPQVALGTHISTWANGTDLGISRNPVNVANEAQAAANFVRSMPMLDFAVVDGGGDRDAGFYEFINGDRGAHWWDHTNQRFPNFDRFHQYLRELRTRLGLPLILWQIPAGNTVMRSVNNTWNHYADNRIEYWLGNYPNDGRMQELANAGVFALLFGPGAEGTTSFEDRNNDGVTNPPPNGSNWQWATVADDDGGYLRSVAGRYLRQPTPIR